MSSWQSNGLVSLLTDFGLSDPYVGVMKGVLYREAPGLRAVIDLTHDVPPQDVRVAAFFLEGSVPFFPAGTLHVVVVDPDVGTARDLLLLECAGQVVIAQDNGVLALLASTHAEARVLRVLPARVPVRGASRTFHGRDRIAPLAALLLQGTPPEQLGTPCTDFRRLDAADATVESDGSLTVEVVLVDRFGNLITNVRRGQLGVAEDWTRGWRCEIAGRQVALAGSYADVDPGELVGVIDSYERFEIAVREGDAARTLGLEQGSTLRLERVQQEARR